MKLKALVLTLVALVAPLAEAQSAQFVYRRTLASGTRTYCKTVGQLNDPFGSAIPGVGLLTTTGASTTVEASVTTAFSSIATPSATKGAIILVSTDSGTTYTPYRVVTKTDNDTIVIDTSVNWAAPGFAWAWFDETCGTGNADGWIACGSNTNLTVAYTGGSSTATVTWEARGSALESLPVQIFPDNSAGAATKSLTAADINNRTTFNLPPGVPFTGCRIGFAGTNPIVSAWIDRSAK